MIYQVTLKNLDGETCKIEVEASGRIHACDLAEEERGAGWMSVDVKVIS